MAQPTTRKDPFATAHPTHPFHPIQQIETERGPPTPMSSPPALRSLPAAQLLPPSRPRRRRLFLSRPARGSRPSCDLSRGASARYGPHPQPLPRLVAAESPPSTSLAAVGAIRRDSETGLALLLVVLAVVSCLSLPCLWICLRLGSFWERVV